MISAVSIRSPFTAPTTTSRAAGVPAASQAVDTVAAPSVQAEAQPSAPPARWKAIGMAALLAAPMIAGALTMAHADEIPAPPPVSLSCTLPSDTVTVEDTPITPKMVSRMQDLGTARVYDNATARGVKNEYAQAFDNARAHADAFTTSAATLHQQGAFLEQYASHDAGSFTDGGCAVTVDKNAAGTSVHVEGDGLSASLKISDGFRMVTVKQGDQDAQTLQESDVERQVLSGKTTRTVYLQDAASHKAGDFEVIIQDGAGRADILPGNMRRAEHIVIRGTTVTDEVRESISGFAGTISVHTTEKFEVPTLQAHVFPQMRLRQTSTREMSDALTHQDTKTTRIVEVRQDGSTHVREVSGDQTQDYVEAQAAIR